MADPQFVNEPIGKLGILPLRGCEEMAKRIDYYLVNSRKDRPNDHFAGYNRESYIIHPDFVRFGSGEGKCVIKDSVRGYDIILLIDPFNYGVTYRM